MSRNDDVAQDDAPSERVPTGGEPGGSGTQVLQHLIWTLHESPMAHEAWLRLLSQKLVLSHLPRPTYRLVASTNVPLTRTERTSRSTIVVGLLGAWSDGDANQIGVTRYGEDLTVIVTCMTELYVPRYAHARLLPIQMVAERFRTLVHESRAHVSDSERQRIEGFLGIVEKTSRADEKPREQSPAPENIRRASILLGMAMLVGAALGGFATEHQGQNILWLTVTAVAALVVAVLATGISFVGRRPPVRRQNRRTVADVTRQKTGYAVETLAGVAGILVVDLIYSLTGLARGHSRPLFVLLLVVAGALPPVLVHQFARRTWQIRWLAAIDGVLAAIDAFRPFKWLNSAAAAVGTGLTSIAVTLVVFQATPEAPGPPVLTGLWEYKTLTVINDEGWLKTSNWPLETWNVASWRKCAPAACPYQVAASDGSRFTLRPIGRSQRTWYGVRHELTECAVETKPNTSVTLEPNGYKLSEALEMTLEPTAHSGHARAKITDSIGATATKAAEEKGCSPTTSARLVAEATLTWVPPGS